MRRIYTYLKLTLKTVIQHPSLKTFYTVTRYARPWYLFNSSKPNPNRKKIPWLCFSAIDHIEKLIRPEMAVFEYGSGNSTIFWASRAKEVISVEHDELWHNKMKQEFLKQGFTNIKYILSQAAQDPDFANKLPENPSGYISSDTNYAGKKFESYVKQIDHYPDNYFDFIIVDGRARPSCVLHALQKLNLNGYLVLDNTERKHYDTAIQLMSTNNWKKWSFYGPVPYSLSFSETSIFQKTQL